MEKYLAEYLRLSIEDGDIVSDDEKQESDSISHQREIIKEYEKKFGLSEMETLEFVDDGYSGTNFNRPAVIKLLAMVREGKIYGIIVKDISRFGREYLEVGDYLEQVFPFLGVRFISINDAYDSNNYIGTTGGIEVALRSILYSMYSKDLSVKMRSALEIRRKHGDFIAPIAPFGYIVQREKQRKLAIDPVASGYVKKVFELACLGYSTGIVAKKLNEEGIPTPALYKNTTNCKRQYKISDHMGYWDAKMVRGILENEVYLGIVVNKKHQVTAVGSKQYVAVPKEEQIRIPDVHEPIVTEEIFHDANKIIRRTNGASLKRKRVEKKSILAGKLYCPECGRKLIRVTCTTIPYYKCKKPDYTSDCKCRKGRYLEPELEAVVSKCMQIEVTKLQDRCTNTLSEKMYKNLDKQIKNFEKEIDTIRLHKQYLYEKLKIGYLNQSEFLGKTKTLRNKEEKLLKDIEKCRISKSEIKGKLEFLSSASDFQYLTKEIVETMISKINVYDVDRVEIFWRFDFLGIEGLCKEESDRNGDAEWQK